MTDRTCSIEGCEGEHAAWGWCNKHYKSWRRLGDPLATTRVGSCSIEGCERKHHARGMCTNHYQVWKTSPDRLITDMDKVCAVSGCEFVCYARGWCRSHYLSWMNHGDPLTARVIARPGEGRSISSHGYVVIAASPGHPLSHPHRGIYEHRKVMYDLGLLVDLSDVVHHIDRDKLNNDPSNLMVMTQAEHVRLHKSEDGESR
jgi:hypothetical protein